MEAFRESEKCREFCGMSFTTYVDKTHSLHLFEEVMPILIKHLTKIFPLVLPEFLQLNLESTVLAKIKKDVILDDGDFLYNMKSDHWIKQHQLEKLDAHLPYKSNKFANDEYFLVKFDRNENQRNIDIIEDNKNVKMTTDRLETNVSDDEIEEHHENDLKNKIKDKMLELLNQVNGNPDMDFEEEATDNNDNFFPVTKKGYQMNMSLEINDPFDFNDFKIDPNFSVKMELTNKAYEEFVDVYEEDETAFKVEFFDMVHSQLQIEILNTSNKGKVFVMSSNQPNHLYIESVRTMFTRVLVIVSLLFLTE
jgi:hypothetical protein